MSFSKISALAGLVALAQKVSAHGMVTGMVAEGVYYEGYYANFQYMQTQPKVVGWSIPEDQSNGFIAPSAYATSDIICHLGATNAQISATVAAGDTVEVQWTAWPSSHHGPVIDYLANCGGDCTTVDKTTLEFFKIDGVGLIDDTSVPGTWASDQLIANNNSWTVTIPSDIVAGNYVLRHEIIALHSAGTADGAQNYPMCLNLQVTGSGTATPSGVLGTALYTETDPGIVVNIYQSLSTYVVPGPTLYSGAVSISQTAAPAATGVASVGTSVGASSATTTVESSAATSASSASSILTSSTTAKAALVTPTLSASAAPYSNSTVSSTKKSACKAKTSKKSAATGSAKATGKTQATTKAAASITTSSTASLSAAPSANTVTIPTTSPGVVVPTTATSVAKTSSTIIAAEASATPTTSASAGNTDTTTTIPSGTTLSTLLSWVSSFYDKYAGTTYSGSTVVSRRHARDVIARAEIEKFDSAASAFKASGVESATHPHATGHSGARPSRGAQPSRAFGAHPSGGFTRPTATPVARA